MRTPEAEVVEHRTVRFERDSVDVAGREHGPEAGSPAIGQVATTDSLAHAVSAKSSFFTTGRSMWRFPTSPGEMPRYMQRAFRVKTFGLLALQQALVLGIMVAVDHIGKPRLTIAARAIEAQVMFYILGMINLFFIMSLAAVKDRYPCNYVLLALTTVVSGVFWGLTRLVVLTVLHFEIAAILCCSMAVAAAMSALLTSLEKKIQPIVVVIISIYSGWAVGAAIAVSVMLNVFEISTLVAFGGAGFSLLLLTILILDAGRFLVRCKPDDFMSVIVSMDSTLMVVVSIPFFVLSFCFLHGSENALDGPEGDEENQIPPVPVTLGRNGEA
eukprot:TRINITY_DN107230_c0_g1_i1.p1 TRINITY_DN107230_c0_g1~~TRINITY_DN107230_c0_g1_i1.p1  ORF type:complete len:382 (+),score=55.11 TRINITY_DN107230_c0_g1_i1:165-1148(+)